MKNEESCICITTSTEETKALAASFAPYVRPGHVIMLTGDLGAGKTQFAQGLAAALGITANVVSPTFNIVISYDGGVGGGRLPLHHFDLYRLESAEELEDIGFYEYVEGDGVTLIEWGDKFPEALPSDLMELTFRSRGTSERSVQVQAYGATHCRLLESWKLGEGAGFLCAT